MFFVIFLGIVEGILDVVMGDLLVIDNDGSVIVHGVVRLQIILWLSELYGKESCLLINLLSDSVVIWIVGCLFDILFEVEGLWNLACVAGLH